MREPQRSSAAVCTVTAALQGASETGRDNATAARYDRTVTGVTRRPDGGGMKGRERKRGREGGREERKRIEDRVH